MPLAAMTDGPTQVNLALGVSKLIVPLRPNRVGLFIVNGSITPVYIAFGGVDASSSTYSWKLNGGEEWALPAYGAIQEVRAYAAAIITLGAGLCYTEFYIP